MEIDSVYKSLDNIDNNVSPSVDNRFNMGTSSRRWGVLSCVTFNVTTVNATTVDTTNIEVTNIKAKDGTTCAAIADTTGIPTFTPAIKLTSDIDVYNNVTTTGWGVHTIYGTGRSTAQNAAVASVATYTVGAADGSFIISANVLVTTATNHNFTATCAYTDEDNTARTVTLNFQQLAGTILTAITNVTGAGPYEGIPIHIRCKAATAITIATTGTFTTVTYNVEGSITQIA